MKDSDMQRLEHMAAYCRDVADAIATYGAGFDAYCANLHFRNSVCMSIMQIGELVGGLSAEFKISTNDRIMWPLIKGLRNIVVHNYKGLNHETIWDIAINNIPSLLRFCEEMLTQNDTAIKE